MSNFSGVVNDPISANGDKEYVDGAYDPAATVDDGGLKGEESKINAPGGTVGEESIKGNQISQQELSDVSTDNKIDGSRKTRGENFLQGDQELDAAVSDAIKSDGGTETV